jgi:hypothetical protein
MSATLIFAGILGIIGFAMYGQLSSDPRLFGRGRTTRQIGWALFGMYASLAVFALGVWIK